MSISTDTWLLLLLGFVILLLLWPESSKRNWRDIPPQELVDEIMQWCWGNVRIGKPRRIYPKVIIDNSTKGSVLGEYHYSSKTIVIYYNKHNTLKGLSETIIHEYVHHLQLRHNRDDAKYDKINLKVGYYDNPFEVEARLLARKFRNQCISDLRVR